ncbi:MAG: rRNA maturation RNase YbeY [Alphaproteobacteria bacterium]
MNAATTAGLHIIVEQRDAAWRDAVPRAEAICRRAAMESLREANADLPDGEVSIVLGDDALLRELNRDWRSIDAPTNVLAFPCDGPGPTETGPVLLGDVVISYQTAAMEAARDGKTIADHLVHLVVHGILHLLAYDHQTDAEARVMEVLETRILGTLHIADPYKDEPAGPE